MSAEADIRVQCHWCGTLTLPPSAVRCAQGDAAEQLALCEFRCPICSRLIILRTTPAGAEAARRVGAAELTGAVPRELLEAHRGPPLSWDDLLELHLSVSRTCCPQEELLA
jgi:hypothetical protein